MAVRGIGKGLAVLELGIDFLADSGADWDGTPKAN
jgi:hypothetical protein